MAKKGTLLQGRVGWAEAQQIACNEAGEGIDSAGCGWKRGESGQWERIFGGITAAERKKAFALRANVEGFASHYGRDNCGFLTLTAHDRDMSPREFGAIFNDIRKVHLRWVRSYIRVLEPQKRGTPHYHLMVAVDFSMGADAFAWDALVAAGEARKRGDLVEAKVQTRVYAESAPERLRECWAELRAVCAKYGLGRSEFLPFRKNSEAVAHYVGKYLEGGLNYKRDEWKGARRVEYDRGESRAWKKCASSFAWASSNAKAWRDRVAELAEASGASDESDLSRIWGPKWAYFWRASIMTHQEEEWRQLLAVTALRCGGWLKDKPRKRVGDHVFEWWPNMDETLAGVSAL